MTAKIFDLQGNILHSSHIELTRQYPRMPQYVNWRGRMYKMGRTHADAVHYYETEQPFTLV